MTLPELPATKGKRGRIRLVDGSSLKFEVVDEIRRMASNHSGKVLYLQKVRFENDQEELRFGYYIIGKKPAMAGRWVWGQFAPFVPAEDFAAIVDEARAKGWI